MKKYRVTIYLTLCFIAGFTFTSFVYLGLWEQFKLGLSSLKWWSYILIVFASFYVTLTLHEFTHFLSFHFNQVKLRAIYLTIFVFYKTEKGWRFKINPKLWILFGGLVVPDLNTIDSHDKYNQTIKAFSKSLIAAPIATITFALCSLISMIFVLLYAKSGILIGFLTIFFIVSILFSLVYIRTFSLSTQTIFGDFVAYKKVKEDEWFQLAQITQYQRFSLHGSHYSPFLFNKVTDLLSTLKGLQMNLFKKMLLLYYFEGVNYYHQKSNEHIEYLVAKVNPMIFGRDETGLMLSYELGIYQYLLKNVEKSYQIYDQIQKIKYKDIDDRLLIYLQYKFEHVTNMEYHQLFLDDLTHVYIDHLWLFKDLINPYEDIEKVHQKCPFVIYETEVQLRTDELERDMI